jgi:hypothetical protein
MDDDKPWAFPWEWEEYMDMSKLGVYWRKPGVRFFQPGILDYGGTYRVFFEPKREDDYYGSTLITRGYVEIRPYDQY